MITVVGISDTHGSHEEVNVPEGDILVVAGDFCTYGKIEEAAFFNMWLGKLPHEHKIVVAGNHDICCQNNYLLSKRVFTNAIYLELEAVTVKGIKFWGCPYSPEFGGWAFAYPRAGSMATWMWDMVPEDTEVLITHGPPAGTALGRLPAHYDRGGEDCGCNILRNRILSLPKLKASFHGHIHEGFGTEYVGNVKCMNVSVMDGRYEVKNSGLVYEHKEI